jgi:hypothetical protein
MLIVSESPFAPIEVHRALRRLEMPALRITVHAAVAQVNAIDAAGDDVGTPVPLSVPGDNAWVCPGG